MVGKLLRSVMRHYGYDVIRYPMPEWYLLRDGLDEILTSLRINCVIDVGANRGQYGEFLRNMGYRGRVVSFEPIPAMFRVLEEKSRKDPDWLVYNCALGSTSQTLDLNVTTSEEFSSLLPVNTYGKEHFQGSVAVTHTESVSVVRLDSILDEVTAGLQNPRIYLKMDTQGYDLQVLDGLGERQSSLLGLQSELAVHPLYEGMPDYLSALARYNELGFSITSMVPVTRSNLRVIEYDCLMIRDSER